MNNVVGSRIKEIRKESKLNQEKFGKIISVSQDTVSLWEQGKSLPATIYIIEICKKFEVSADFLLGLKDY